MQIKQPLNYLKIYIYQIQLLQPSYSHKGATPATQPAVPLFCF